MKKKMYSRMNVKSEYGKEQTNSSCRVRLDLGRWEAKMKLE